MRNKNNKQNSNNKKKSYKRGKTFKKSSLLFLGFIVILAITLVMILVLGRNKNTKPISTTDKYRAAIIDQLSFSFPNENFIFESENILKKAGFEVTVYNGNDVDVELFRELPNYNYDLIIFRAHSGLSTVEGKINERTYIFTNEKYSYLKYSDEQLNDELHPAKVSEDAQGYFAIGPKFITNCLKENFNNTVIIMAGCAGLKLNDLAEAFIRKGASCYISWDASLTSDYMDKATINLLDNLCNKQKTMENSINEVMKETGFDPNYNAFLKFYPPWAKDKKLSELIGK